MSSADIAFVKQLAISSSEVARMLEISRQSVSRGLRSDKDYLDPTKLKKISEVAPLVFDIDPKLIQRLVDKFYPSYQEGMERSYVATQVNLSIDSDIYLACNKLPYYMSTYRKLFVELASYIRVCKQKRIIFAFQNQDTLRYSRKQIITWLGDDRAVGNSSVIVCQSIEAFPFSVGGYDGKKPVIYFCDGDGFVRQNENNSRCIVKFIEGYIERHNAHLKPLR